MGKRKYKDNQSGEKVILWKGLKEIKEYPDEEKDSEKGANRILGNRAISQYIPHGCPP